MQSNQWLIFLAIPAIFVVAIGLNALYVHHRRKKIAQVADEMGFSFEKSCPSPDEFGCGHLDLFQKGRSRRGRNLIQGMLEDVQVALFDYRYTTGHGKHKHTYHQTVAAFVLPTAVFPGFTLCRESFFHKIGQLVGFQDIDLPDHPDFSKRYLLRGKDEQAVRGFFGDKAVQFFEQFNEKWNVEAEGRCLVVYRPSKLVSPSRLADFLHRSWEMFLAFPTT